MKSVFLIAAAVFPCLAFQAHSQATQAGAAAPVGAHRPAAGADQAVPGGVPLIAAQPVIPVRLVAGRLAARRKASWRARATAAELSVRAANRKAMLEPTPHAFMNAAQVYPWSDGALYRLMAAPGAVTDIALQVGEAISSVAAGDTVRWTVGDTSSGAGEEKRAHILVKPFAAGLSTNLIIATDRRTYHLEMLSTPGTAMSAISWTYPQGDLLAIRRQRPAAEPAGPAGGTAGEQQQARGDAAPLPRAAGLSLDHLNFAYTISGDNPAWRPLRAFDDGRQTFIEFPASIGVGEAPPLFVLGAQGEAQLVNYRMAGRYYVVDRLFAAAQLRLGTKKQAVVTIARAGRDASRHEGGKAS